MSDTNGERTVLVVDDEPLVREVVQMYLEGDGYRVLAVDGGEAALGAVAGGGVDVVVTDCAMPGMTGEQLAAALRARGFGMPIIFLTGYADAVAETGVPGPCATLGKPFTMEALRAVLASVCGSAGGAG